MTKLRELPERHFTAIAILALAIASYYQVPGTTNLLWFVIFIRTLLCGIVGFTLIAMTADNKKFRANWKSIPEPVKTLRGSINYPIDIFCGVLCAAVGWFYTAFLVAFVGLMVYTGVQMVEKKLKELELA